MKQLDVRKGKRNNHPDEWLFKMKRTAPLGTVLLLARPKGLRLASRSVSFVLPIARRTAWALGDSDISPRGSHPLGNLK